MSNKTILKLGIFGAIVVALRAIWENDAAINAVVLFCTAGVVPGTGVVLSPEQVYVVLGVLLLLATVLIFWRQWRQLFSRLVRMRSAARAREAVAQELQVTETPAVPEKTGVIVIKLPPTPSYISRLWRLSRPYLIAGIGAALAYTIKALQIAGAFLRDVSLRGYRYADQAWLWVEPYLRRFDQWLEQTLKRNKDTAAVLHVLSECTKAVHVSLAEAYAWVVGLRARFGRAPRLPEE